MKKKLCMLMVALLAMTPALAACQPGGGPSETSPDTSVRDTTEKTEAPTSPETEAPATDAETLPETEPVTEAPQPSGMVVTKETVIYCPTRRNRALYKLSQSLVTSIQEKTGMKLTVRYGGDDQVPAESEIILTFCPTREASLDAYHAIPSNQYGVHTQGSTAVLAAWTEEDLSAAADLFLETALVKEGDFWIIQPQSVTHEGQAPAAALTAYRLVYPANASAELVESLIPLFQERIKELYDLDLIAVSDAEEPAPYEILFGNTNRTTDTVRPYLEGENALSAYRYAVIPEGNNIYLAGSSPEALIVAAGKVLSTTSSPVFGPRLLGAVSEIYESPAMITEDKIELAEGATLRIMSYNMLNQDYVPDNPLPEERDNRLTELLLYYKPDVIGAQEINIDWHNSFDALLPTYLPACKYHSSNQTAQTTFLYNPQTVKLVEEYVVHYRDWENSDIRVVSFAIFETSADGKRFVMTNTHPAPHAEHYSGHMVELNRILTEELAKYADLPVIMTGDFNTRENQTEYTTLMDTQNVKDAKYDAEILVRNVRTYTSLPSGEAVGGAIVPCNGGSIDHIFINDKVDAKLFNIIVDHDVVHISDHLPIYADIVLK